MKHFLTGYMRTTTVITALCLFFMVFPQTVAQAQVISPHTGTHKITTTARPNVSGGGCNSTSSGNRNRYIAYSACSTYFFFKIFADSYVTFGAASPGLWRACTVYVYLYDGNYNYVDGRSFNCLSQARSNDINDDFGFSDITGFGRSYYTLSFVYYYYNPDGRGNYGPFVWSPEQFT